MVLNRLYLYQKPQRNACSMQRSDAVIARYYWLSDYMESRYTSTYTKTRQTWQATTAQEKREYVTYLLIPGW